MNIARAGWVLCFCVGLCATAQASDRDLPWAFKGRPAEGYSIDLVSIEPEPGTKLEVGSSVDFKLTVSYEMSVADHGSIILVFQDEKNRSVTNGAAPVVKEVTGNKGVVSLTATITVPKGIKEIRLFVPLQPAGLTVTYGELTFRYPVVRARK